MDQDTYDIIHKILEILKEDCYPRSNRDLELDQILWVMENEIKVVPKEE